MGTFIAALLMPVTFSTVVIPNGYMLYGHLSWWWDLLFLPLAVVFGVIGAFMADADD